MKKDLNFVEEGSGTLSLVFLHYFGGSAQTWKNVIEPLKEGFRCIAMDLPGFGDSAALQNQRVGNAAAKVSEVIARLALKKFVLVGHSMGGKIALAVAAAQPEGLQKLVLVAPSPPTPEPMTDKQRSDLLNAYGDKAALEKVAGGLVAKPLSPGQMEAVVADNLRVDGRAWGDWINEGSREDISLQTKSIAVPLGVISGDADPNFSTAFLKGVFTRYFSGVDFFEVKEAGHLLPVEKPQALASAVRALVQPMP